MFKEVKDLVPSGKIADLAIGVAIGVTLGTVIGTAFLKLVAAVLDDVVNPIIGAVIPHGLDFRGTYVMLRGNAPEGASLAEARSLGTPLAIGDLVSTVINLVVLAVVFVVMIRLMVKIVSVFYRPTPATPSAEAQLLEEIRDLLAKGSV